MSVLFLKLNDKKTSKLKSLNEVEIKKNKLFLTKKMNYLTYTPIAIYQN